MFVTFWMFDGCESLYLAFWMGCWGLVSSPRKSVELWAPTYNWLGAHLVGFRLKTNPHLFGDLLPNKLPVTVELSHFALRGLISSVFNI